MERQGIAVVDPIGAPFDPNLHEAMTMVDNAEVEPGSVVDVFQKGLHGQWSPDPPGARHRRARSPRRRSRNPRRTRPVANRTRDAT